MGKSTAKDELKSFFLACARKSFWDLGLRDNTVIEYISGLLSAFAHSALYRLHGEGQRIDSLVAILALSWRCRRQATPRPTRTGSFVNMSVTILCYDGVFRSYRKGHACITYRRTAS
jgi:hypothetical protein